MRYFKRPIPKGYQIYTTFEVTGLHIDANREVLDEFMLGDNLEISFELEPQNPHDANAIKVVGTFDRITSSSEVPERAKLSLGYIPRQISEGLHKTEIFSVVIPRLYSSSEHGDRWVDMTVDILGPKDDKLLSKYHDYFEQKRKSRPASPRDLAFLKLTQYELDEQYTVGEAEYIIDYMRKKFAEEPPELLANLDGLLQIIDSAITEFSDNDFIEDYGMMAAPPEAVIDAVVLLSISGLQAAELVDQYEPIAKVILALNPSLAIEQN